MARFLLTALTTLAVLAGCSGSSRPTGDTGDVTGTTVEETTFTPVVGARVDVGGQSATSGAGGAFTVTAVPKGEQKLTVTAGGYLPFSTSVTVDPGANDVGQLWLKRSQQDGGQEDAGVEDAPVQQDGQADTNQHDGQTDVLQQDAQHDAQTDVQEDAQHDAQTDHIQTDVQSDLGQTDGAVVLPCGTLALNATQIGTGVDIPGATWSGTSLTAPHATSPCVYGGAGTENVYWYDLDHQADLVWSVSPSAAWNVVAYIRQECDGLDGGGNAIPDQVCADVAGVSGPEKVEWLGAQPGRYFFFVDAQTASDWGTYVARLAVREIHGLGQDCDGVQWRCQDGLTCQEGKCWTLTGWCDHAAAGTLQVGTQSGGDTTAAGNRLQCDYAGNSDDQWWKLTADSTGGLYTVHVTSSHPLYLYTTTDCTNPDASTTCTGWNSTEEWLDVTLPANGSTYVVVDAYLNGSTGQPQVGAYTIQPYKVAFHGATGSCDGHANRCNTGLTCQGETCYEVAAWCAVLIKGTLVQGWANRSSGNTSTAATNHLTCGASGQEIGPDDVWKLTAGTNDTFVVGVTSNDHNVAAYTTPDCTSSALAANCTGGTSRNAFFDVALQAGQSVYVVVDGRSGQQGAYEVGYERVQYLQLGDQCYPAEGLYKRCVAGTYCDTTTTPPLCAAVMTESEVNDTYGQADPATSARPITGTMATSADVDWFAVGANTGDLIVAETSDGATSKCANKGLDSNLTIYRPDGASEIEYNDDIDFDAGNWCSFAAGRTNTTGTHYVKLARTSGVLFDYTLRIWVITPTYLGEAETNNAYTEANPLGVPAVVSGDVNPGGGDAIDFYSISVGGSRRLYARTANGTSSVCGSTLPSIVQLYGPDGVVPVATSPAACDWVRGDTPSGGMSGFVSVSSSSGAFNYALEVFALPR